MANATSPVIQINEGNVGIGTTNPTVALDVAGAGKFTGQVTIPATPLASTDAANKAYVDAQVGGADTLQEVTDNGATTTNSILIHNSATSFNPRLSIGRSSSESIQFNVTDTINTIQANQDSDSNGDHKFILNRAFNGSGENDFQISKAGSPQLTVDTNGNVGIGTDSPASKLEIFDNSSSTDPSTLDSNFLLLTNGDVAEANETWGIGFNSNNVGTNKLGAYIHAIGNYSSNYNTSLAFGTRGAGAGTNVVESLRINSSGNVGIGTTSPDHLLDLYKSTSTSSASTGTTLQRLWNYVGSDLNQQKTFIDFVFQDDNDNQYPQVRIGAEVGQNGDANTTEKEGSGAFVVYTNNAPNSTPATNALAERFRVDYAGNVGIGTTSPTVALDVVGAGKFTGQVTIPATPSASTDAASKGYVDAQVGSADTLQEVTDNGNTTTNSVGIGTTNPKSKLDVNGVFCVDSKTHTVTDAFTTCLTVNLDSHAGCHVVITVFGDWSAHSSAAYRGEFFLQNGANGYGEPGIILRQDDNTFTGTDQIICQIVDPTSTANPKDFQIQIRHTDTTSPASWTGQLTYTVQGKFNSIT